MPAEKYRPIILAVITLFSVQAIAQEASQDSCDVHDPTRRRVESQVMNDRGRLGPPRDQDNTAYCYAYTAADLLTHWLKRDRKIPDSEYVSAIGLALRDKKEAIEGKSFQESLRSTIEKRNQCVEDASLCVPQFGRTDEAIRRTWPDGASGNQICFETEVSSRDNGLRQGLAGINPVTGRTFNLEAALGTMAVAAYTRSTEDHCRFVRVADQVLPSATQSQIQELLFQLNGDRSEVLNPFDSILSQACRSKTGLTESPKMMIQRVSAMIQPLDAVNQPVINGIDTALSLGQISEVSYRATILSRGGAIGSDGNDFHSSVIIGSAKVCGKDYYVLRNSYGKDQCNNQRNQFTQKGAFGEQGEELTQDLLKLDQEKKQCEAEQSAECYERVSLRRAQRVDVPYFCDSEGNYVIRKEYMARGVFRSTWISN
ncbi:MAG: hypothetical protein KGQ59_03845 [Bdellovibrionales bacterium]|nr:hypothetical protein [Bdellovibrionales bacterium]